ncbi:MAG: hypothetical protein HOW73_23755 [Polyangiaceae bacterium]|nr:hypothetical protein [Polyangiaceae bacterium]
MRRLCFLTFTVLLLACGDSEADGPSGGSNDGGNDGPGGSNDGGSNTGASNAGGSDAGGSGTGGSQPFLPTCRLQCSTPSDCFSPSPLFDQDNWSCEESRCVYLGCQNATECEDAFQAPGYDCVAPSGSSVPTCIRTCGQAADCASPSPVADADNWTCEDSVCVYLGCNSSTECQDTFQSPNYECTTLSGATVPSCNLTCSAPPDCASPTPNADADNWACEDSSCVYLGCNSTAECQDSLMNANYVCE